MRDKALNAKIKIQNRWKWLPLWKRKKGGGINLLLLFRIDHVEIFCFKIYVKKNKIRQKRDKTTSLNNSVFNIHF